MEKPASTAEAVIADAFGSGGAVYLAFSGGKESLTLLKLCEPYEGRFKLIWANTGYTFPHVESLIRSAGERFGLVKLKSDMSANWRANGWPSEIATVDSALSRNAEIRLQPWAACCFALKSVPIMNFFAERPGPAILLHGQRIADGWKPRVAYPPHVTVASPLADWSTEDVFAFVEAEGISLPDHYSEIADSLDCWICPAQWGMAHGPAYGRYMARQYPDLANAVLPTAHQIHSYMERAVARMQQALHSAEMGTERN